MQWNPTRFYKILYWEPKYIKEMPVNVRSLLEKSCPMHCFILEYISEVNGIMEIDSWLQTDLSKS